LFFFDYFVSFLFVLFLYIFFLFCFSFTEKKPLMVRFLAFTFFFTVPSGSFWSFTGALLHP